MRFYLSLSFELFWQYRLERGLQKINDCQSNIVYVFRDCSYCLLGNTVLKKKNALKSLAFSKKLVTNLFSSSSGGIKGILLLFKKHFNKNQYAVEFLWRLFSLPYASNNYFLVYLLSGLSVLEESLICYVIENWFCPFCNF